MAAAQAPNDIILFHYPFSPYARRVVYYLTLRNIPYAQCLLSHIMPRPDLAALGISYRRIPLLSIGNDVYADTRLIIAKLEEIFPPSAEHPALSTPASKALEILLTIFVVDSGVFARAASLIPTSLPVMKDPKFAADRDDFTGRKGSFTPENLDRGRPESLAHMRVAFDLYENMLEKGFDWVIGGDRPSLADLNALWPLVWMKQLGSLPDDLFGPAAYPRTNAWVSRFEAAVKDASKKGPKPVTLTGEQAFDFITGSRKQASVQVQSEDPLKVREDQIVAVFPLDSGSAHKDQGRLVGLTKGEVAIAIKTKKDPSKEIRLHAPRWGFRVMPVGTQAKI